MVGLANSMLRKLLPGAILLGIGSANGNAGIPLGTEPVVLSEDGGWFWFESPRIVLQGQRLIVGSVAGGAGGAERRGDIEAVAYDLQTRTASVVQLRDKLGFDDHASPAILARPDGPVMPSGGGGTRRALVWLRGKYKAYTDFRQQVVALVWRN